MTDVPASPATPSEAPDAPGRPGRRRVHVPELLGEAAWLFVLLRVLVSVLAVLVVIGGRDGAICPGPGAAGLPPDGPWHALVGVFYHWDACWYWKIAGIGYGLEDGTGSTAFFPLLPLLTATLAQVRGNVPIASIAVNAVALIVGLAGIGRLVARDFDLATAQRTMLYLALFPAAIFLVAPFSEPLFIAGAAWAFVGARERRWEWAIAGGLVAGLSRPLGVLLVVPIGWELLRMVVERWRGGGPRVVRWDIVAGLAVAAPAIAWLGFVAWSGIVIGQSTIAANAQWGSHELVWPWVRFGQVVDWALTRHRPAPLVNAAVWAVFAVLALVAIRKLPVSYWLFAIPTLVLSLTQHTVWPFMSTSRYMMAAFPLLVVPALAGRNRRFHATWLAGSTVLLAFLATRYFEGVMVG